MERMLLRWLAEFVGYPETAAGEPSSLDALVSITGVWAWVFGAVAPRAGENRARRGKRGRCWVPRLTSVHTRIYTESGLVCRDALARKVDGGIGRGYWDGIISPPPLIP